MKDSYGMKQHTHLNGIIKENNFLKQKTSSIFNLAIVEKF